MVEYSTNQGTGGRGREISEFKAILVYLHRERENLFQQQPKREREIDHQGKYSKITF